MGSGLTKPPRIDDFIWPTHYRYSWSFLDQLLTLYAKETSLRSKLKVSSVDNIQRASSNVVYETSSHSETVLDSKSDVDIASSDSSTCPSRPVLPLMWMERRCVLLNGVFWCVGSLFLLDQQQASRDLDNPQDPTPVRDRILQLVDECWCQHTLGYKAHPAYEASLIATLAAVQLKALLQSPWTSDQANKIVSFIEKCRDPLSGGFFHTAANSWIQEADMRHTLCALAALDELKTFSSSAEKVLLQSAQGVKGFVLRSYNPSDGGMGAKSARESHGGFLYCGVASLYLTGHLKDLECDVVIAMLKYIRKRLLADEATGSLHFTGRPGKHPDVCYQWWFFAAYSLLESQFAREVDFEWFSGPEKAKICEAVLAHQAQQGGLSSLTWHFRHAGAFETKNVLHLEPDVYHTYFGLAALALVQPGMLATLEPAKALPCSRV